MIELTEALVLSRQINQSCLNKKIINISVNQNPHKMAWLNKDLNEYSNYLIGSSFKLAKSYGGMLEIDCDKCHLVFTDGLQLTYCNNIDLDIKHQLLIEFSDHTYFIASVRMYGGIWCYTDVFDNPYYFIAKKKPSLFSSGFSLDYFNQLISDSNESLSLKAFLATEQRIPGFGNGLCQDVLWKSKLHPKTKIRYLRKTDITKLYETMIDLTNEIVSLGGRDTEKDLFGNKGGYITKMSQSGINEGCPECGTSIIKENYLGGNIYTCPKCQIKQ